MDIEKKKTTTRSSSTPANTAEPAKNPQGRSWDHIETDLKEALNTWSDLTEELAGKVSPEEEQLQEIKTLLGTLRDKLKEFSQEGSELAEKPTSQPSRPPEHNK